MSLAQDLLKWYDRDHRALPWRAPIGSKEAVDPYYVLVSEAMLQQTQVATVMPYFNRFIAAFPSVHKLAIADEQSVLRLWQGLGYYARARNLRSCAKKIVEDFAGEIPSDLQSLRSLPGVGRYTAGAIASIAFNRRAAIVDGNVARVICRLDVIESDPREPETREIVWKRALEILPRSRPGDFNQALMELGATVCTPRNPRCRSCPWKEHCRALAMGMQDRIPVPRKSKSTPMTLRWTLCIHRACDDRLLIEQRAPTGRWASMWQFVTIARTSSRKPTARTFREFLSFDVDRIERIARLNHALTHRRYDFDVYRCRAEHAGAMSQNRPRKWVRLRELSKYPMPRPHVKIAELLSESYIKKGVRAPAVCSLPSPSHLKIRPRKRAVGRAMPA